MEISHRLNTTDYLFLQIAAREMDADDGAKYHLML